MKNFKFYEWLGGLIDADGEFYISKSGYGSIEITMHIKEIQTLYFIKSECQGKVTLRKGVNVARWRLHKQEPLIETLTKLLGNIRIAKRQIQYQKICKIYDIDYKIPHLLTYDNAWFSGFFTGKGCISINKTNFMAVISVSQKEKDILENIQYIFKGNISFDISLKIWIWQCNNFDCEYLLTYFEKNNILNPYKQAKIRGFKRFLFYKAQKYHLDPLKRKRLLHFIKKFNSIYSL
uniref:A1i3orf = ymf43 protein n=1 Tax=Prototheca wickerhamii TaxID=3111 RepID=Q35689_PROWI|nr:hypothetical protein [Prototheca wickerhamii]AAD12632.1 orf234.2, group I orf in cox1 intron 3 [Prototheca wickerhamii]